MNQKKVLVTGAASGVGQALSLELAKKGCSLYLLDKNAVGLDQTLSQIDLSSASAHVCDLSEADALGKTCDEILAKSGGVDVLINCAAIETHGKIEDVPMEAFRLNYEVNFNAPLYLTKRFLPAMKQKGDAQIVNISSAMGRRSVPGKSAYCITKFALNAFTESLRLETQQFGVHVMMVSPGPIDSNLPNSIIRYGIDKFQYESGLNRKSPAYVACKIIDGMEKKKTIVREWGMTEVFLYINCLFPRLADYILSKKIPT